MGYLQWLQYLAQLGPNLVKVLPLLFAAIDLMQQVVSKLGEIGTVLGIPNAKLSPTAPVAMAAFEVSAVEAEAETHLASLAKSHGIHASGVGDGRLLTAIRTGWQFLQKHPELAKLMFGSVGFPLPAGS